MTTLPASEETAPATDIVEAIFTDLRDRRFLKWLFDKRGIKCLIGQFADGEELCGLDLEVQSEIKAAWSAIIEARIRSEREQAVRECAEKLAECKRDILGKQDGKEPAVDTNLRLMAVALDVAHDAILSLSQVSAKT